MFSSQLEEEDEGGGVEYGAVSVRVRTWSIVWCNKVIKRTRKLEQTDKQAPALPVQSL